METTLHVMTINLVNQENEEIKKLILKLIHMKLKENLRQLNPFQFVAFKTKLTNLFPFL